MTAIKVLLSALRGLDLLCGSLILLNRLNTKYLLVTLVIGNLLLDVNLGLSWIFLNDHGKWLRHICFNSVEMNN